jgi:hypothetical protein
MNRRVAYQQTLRGRKLNQKNHNNWLLKKMKILLFCLFVFQSINLFSQTSEQDLKNQK